MNELKALEGLSTPALLILALNAFMWLFKKTPGIPNWLIPWFSTGLGLFGYCAMQGSFEVRNVLLGIGVGMIPVGVHQLFKQTVENVTANKLTLIPISLAVLVFSSGCVGPNASPDQAAVESVRTAGIVQISAQLGTYSVIKREPKARAYFEAATVAITVFVSEGNLDPVQLRNTLRGLRVADANVEEATLAIEAALTLYRTYFNSAKATEPDKWREYVTPILAGLRDGIRQGLDARATEIKYELKPL